MELPKISEIQIEKVVNKSPEEAELTPERLRKMTIGQLELIAEQYAAKLQWMHSIGRHETEPERYERVAGELYHLAALIDDKKSKKVKKKYKMRNN